MRIFALRGPVAWCFVSPFLFSAQLNPHWTTHTDPGYSVQLPPGWTASPDRQKGWVHLMGTEGEDVVIWPVFIPEAPAIPDLRSAQSIHLKLAAACPYHADWEVPQEVGSHALRARGKSQNMTAVSVFAWLASPRGTAAWFYVAGARATDFGQKQADLAKVLQSFRLVGVGGEASAGGLQFVPFADPREGAFTVDVPAGWKTGGGLFRASPFVSHPVVETDSPDGQTRVALGDAQLPTSFSNSVQPYLTGAQYCLFYVRSRIPTFCSDLQITDMKDSPPVEKPAPMPMTAAARFTIGSLSFSCREQGRPRTGYCMAKTTISIPPPQLQMPSMGWRAEELCAYIAPPEGAGQAEAVLNRMRNSFRVNTQWGMREIQGAGQRSRIISGTTQEIAGMAESSQRYRDAVDDRIARLRSNTTLGVTDVVDPATGRRTTVDSGSGYYWVDNRGMILGTSVDTSPGVDFRRLLELPGR